MTIQIQKSVCAGLDVHKNNVYACVCCSVKDPKTNVDVLKLKSKKFRSNHTDLSEMCDWILEMTMKILKSQPHDPIDVYMESTGKYSTPVYNVCEEKKLIPHIVNPKHVRMITGQKTDQKDAAWIAELGINGLIRESYIPEYSRIFPNGAFEKPDDCHARGQNLFTSEATISVAFEIS